MILAKYFIYINKQEIISVKNISMISFLPILRKSLDIEKMVCLSKNNKKAFTKYNNIYTALEGDPINTECDSNNHQ
jgi:MinD-like ATPase involved in chromosome partitioning or flagellar assembly